jgi:hypothetical protein
MTKNIDTGIDELFAVLQKQRVEVEKTEKETKKSWKTTCTIRIASRAEQVNLQTANEATIQQVLADLLIHRDYSAKAAHLLGLDDKEEYANFKYDDWLEDCQKRIAVLKIKEKKARLDIIEKRIDGIVSPEKRREMEFENLKKDLGV